VKSLFLRIFLWFWAAMAVVVVVLVVSSPLMTRSHPGVERWRQHTGEFLDESVDRVATRLEMGEPADEGDRPRSRRRQPTQVYVLDRQGVEQHGRAVDRSVRELADRAADSGEEVSERSGSTHRLARPVIDPDGRPLVVVGELRRPPRPMDLLDPQILVPRLAVLTLVIGLFCFWLARYLSAPVASLRTATRSLAAGDLSARVGPPVADRRDETGDLARDFDAMAERLETLVGSQRRLLRDVSHELRSPLARLGVALELARQRAGESASKPLDRIEQESKRLEALIERLLSLERLQAGIGHTDGQLVDLHDLIEKVVADARYEADAGGGDVRFVSAARPRVTGSPELLHSAVENVIRNGIAHTAPASTVDVWLGEEQYHGGRVAVVRVRDRGPGVPPEELERLFDAFHRVEDARDRQTGGVGLGLAITERAVRAHGGEVEARNHPEGGLEVTIRLPVADR